MNNDLNFKKINKNTLSIITYHFIRKKNDRNYKGIKYLKLDDFKKQIKYFRKKYTIIDQNTLIKVINSKKNISNKPLLVLTFDDGYVDHYKYVFPILKKNKISGIFYLPASILKKKFILNVNKIQFIITKFNKTKLLLNEIDNYLKKHSSFTLRKILSSGKIKFNRQYGNNETTLIKGILQYHLPNPLRQKLVDFLFKKFFKKKDYIKNLYLNKKQIIEMKKSKMNFGIHGVNHDWFEYMSTNEQKLEIKNLIKFFKKIFPNEKKISICYPYGSYDSKTSQIARKAKIDFGLTINKGVINLNKKFNKLFLPRIDTNYFL